MARLFLFVASALLALSTAAGAATLSVTTDKSTYTVGEKIWLTLTADAEGAIGGCGPGQICDVAIWVTYDPALAENGPLEDRSFPDPSGWIAAAPFTEEDGYLSAAANLLFAGGFEWDVQVATASLIAESVGVVNLGFGAPDGHILVFGDVPGGPSGTSFTIVPEPGTTGLVALGLAALDASRRRVYASPSSS